MFSRFVRICAIALACAVSMAYSTRAEEGHNTTASKHPWVKELLSHADDLNINADQKAKLTEVLDGPAPKSRADYTKVKEKVQAILSKEQWEKMENFYKQREEARRAQKNNGDDNDDHK